MKKIVVIIGGSDGIGKETARIFVKNGDTVYNCSRHACELEGVINKELDVVNTVKIGQTIDEIVNECGRIDILINSAGYSISAPLEHVEAEDYRYLFEVNFFGIIETIKAVTPHMKEYGGRIVNISSLGGVVPIPYDPYYSASKAALNMFTEGIQFELNKWGIYVTSLMPGGTDTRFTFKRKVYSEKRTAEYSEDMKKVVKELTKVEQLGMPPKRVAGAAFMLCQMPDPPIYSVCGCKNKLIYAFSKYFSKRCVRLACRIKYGI